MPTESRRPTILRFSLWQMFLALTLVGVLAGYYINAIKTQERSVMALRRVHAMVTYDFQRAAGRPGTWQYAQARSHYPQWLVRHLGLDWFHTVVAVSINDATPENLEHVARLRGLESLWLGDTILSTESIRTLARTRSLTHLAISETSLEPDVCAELVRLPSVTHLELRRVQITDAGFECFRHAKRLRILTCESTVVPEAALVYIRDMKNLEELNLGGTSISASALHQLSGMRNLNRLTLSHGMLGGSEGNAREDWESLKRTLPNCTISYAIE